MKLTINAVDSEFAVSTGSNVDYYADSSRFDYPPTSSKNLTITSNANDPSPRDFSVGDTYDIVYGNGGGGKGGTFDDAVVIRSDALPGGGAAVVFEGVNQDGDLEQIVWTPNFDLESWFFDNFNNGKVPGFYNSDLDGATEFRYVCFSAETMLATAEGWVPAGRIRVGDRIETLDTGLQPVLWIGRRRLTIDRTSDASVPVLIHPKAAPGIEQPVIVSPQHRLMLSTPGDGDIFAPAKACLEMPGVRQMRGRSVVDYISILCPEHSILNASGLAAESFLPGPQGFKLLKRDEIRAVRAALTGYWGARPLSAMIPARPCFGGAAGRRALKNGAVLGRFHPQPAEIRKAG